MLVTLATTLHPLRAHMAAGVLQEHGIEAHVWGDLHASGYSPITTGGCQLMVDDADAPEAAQILNAHSPPPEETGEPPAVRGRFSAAEALGTGVIQGATHLPLLMMLCFFLELLLYALGRILRPYDRTIPEGLLPESIVSVAFSGVNAIITGALFGLLCGWVTWLFSDYRHGGKCGAVFVGLVTMFIILPEAPLLLAVFVLRLLEAGHLIHPAWQAVQSAS